jgi:class 3 adenylate cyclase
MRPSQLFDIVRCAVLRNGGMLRNVLYALQCVVCVGMCRLHCRYLDGNAVYASGYHRALTLQNNEFNWIGDSAVATWGCAAPLRDVAALHNVAAREHSLDAD